MSTNPYEEASERRKPGRGRIWAAIIAAAALVTTVAWAAPQGSPKPVAELSTEGTGHITAAGGQVTLTETLRFEEAQPDEEYVVSASLHLLGEDGADQGVLTRDGKAIEVTANVRPVDDGRVLRLPITFDARGMEGKTVACFASLSKGDATIARWQDAKDESQIVRFPKLTGEFEGIDGGNEVLNEGTLRLRTSLSFENLIEGEDYRLNVVIVDASTCEPLRDGSGKEIGMARKLASTMAKGKESFTIEADGAPCAGRCIAMTAKLSLGEKTIATYDGTKTDVLTVPKIASETGAATVDVDASKERDVATIKETVRYEGLVPGTTYVLSGAVRDGKAGVALLDGDNEVVEGTETTTELTPTEASGTVELTYRIDVAALAGRDVVTCDILTRKADGRIVAEWDGVANGKTVLLASATSASVGTHTSMSCEPAWGQAGVTSVVSYEGLEAGKEYVAEGELRLLSENGSDSGAVTDAGGSPVKAHEAFVPTEAEGTVELRYELDATALEGKRLTARETVGREGMTVARVTDNQTVAVTSVDVTMRDTETGLSESMAREDGAFAVKVEYGNVPAGEDAYVECVLTDALTGRPLLGKNGAQVSARKPIEALPEGEALLTLTADTSDLAGHGVAANVTVCVGGTVVASSAADAVVSIPKVAAKLASASNGRQVASESSMLVAELELEGLSATSPHVASARIVDARTGEPMRSREGGEVVGVSTVDTGQSSGTAEVAIKLGAEDLAGRTLGVEATVAQGDVVTARTSVAEGAVRSVRIPKAEVEAVSEAFGDAELPLDERAKAIVRVSYQNLEPGLGYVASCSLVARGDDARELVAAEARFEPEDTEGIVEVPLSLDTRELAGREIVARSTISLEDDVVARTETADDKGLRAPSMSTTLHASGSDAKVVDAKAGTTLVDTITYTNLTPGVEYAIEGELVDARTGKTAMASVSKSSGSAAASQSQRQSAQSNAEASAKDAFKGKADSTMVWVASDGTYHLDKACSSATGALRRTTLGIAKAAGKTPCKAESGTEQEVRQLSSLSSSTTASKSADTREVERPSKATVRFTPREPNGTVDVEFAIDTTGLEGKRLVALDTMTRSGHTVAIHRDLSDVDQSVDVSGVGTAGSGESAEEMGQTGAGILPFIVLGSAAVLIFVAILAMWGVGRDDDGDGE